MSKFLLSETIDRDKIFLTNISDVKERLDPLFYKAVQNIKKSVENKAKFHCDKLVKACTIKRGRFGHRPRNDPKFYGGDYPFIQTGDIVKASENNGKIEYTQTLNELGLQTSKMLQPPQLLFTIAANIGDTAILDYPSCFPDSIVALIPKDKDNLLLEYFNIYLKVIKPYIVELAPYSAQRNLNNQQLAQVPLITPPKDIQAKIVHDYHKSLATKYEKEIHAKKLLESIDEYLLGELGISIPEKDNSLKNRIFTTSLSKVSGIRFDPKYSLRIEELYSQNWKYKKVPLKELLICNPQYGANEEAIDGNPAEDIRYIRITDIDEFGNLKSKDWKTATITEEKYFLENNDILFARSGSVGRCYIHKDISNKFIFAGYLIRFKVNKDKINPDFLFFYCNSKIYKNWVEAIQRPAVQANINSEEYKSLNIPMPPIEKQNQIVAQITQIREQATHLQKEAVEELEKAKKKVEQIILGDKNDN